MYTSDIQPLVTTPEITVQTDIGPGNYRVDVNDQQSVQTVVGNVSNHISLRGASIAPASGSARLIAVPSSISAYPSQYSQTPNITWDHTRGGDVEIGLRMYNTMSSTQSSSPVVVTETVNLTDLPPTSDHYRLVTECKSEAVDSDGILYEVAREETRDFVTVGETSNPYIVQRNISYVSVPTAPSQVFQTSFTIPHGFSSAKNWKFEVQTINCPLGSYVEIDSNDADVAIERFTISKLDQLAGCEFTGKAPGFTCQVTIRWYANGTIIQSGQRIQGNLYPVQVVTSAISNGLFEHRKIVRQGYPVIRRQASYINVATQPPVLRRQTSYANVATQLTSIGGGYTRQLVGQNYVPSGVIHVDTLVGADGVRYLLA